MILKHAKTMMVYNTRLIYIYILCIYKYIFIGLKHVETTNFPGEPGPISLGARLLPTLCGACRSAGGGRPLCDTLEPGARRRRALDFRRPGRGEGTVARGAALGRIFSQPLFHPRHRWAKDGGHSFFKCFFPLLLVDHIFSSTAG